MYVFCVTDTVISFGGSRVRLRPGQPWLADDPLVAAHPDYFRSDPPGVFSSANGGELGPVEQATAAPGERRSVRRGR